MPLRMNPSLAQAISTASTFGQEAPSPPPWLLIQPSLEDLCLKWMRLNDLAACKTLKAAVDLVERSISNAPASGLPLRVNYRRGSLHLELGAPVGKGHLLNEKGKAFFVHMNRRLKDLVASHYGQAAQAEVEVLPETAALPNTVEVFKVEPFEHLTGDEASLIGTKRVHQLIKSGGTKRPMEVAPPDWQDRLQMLAARFPNFKPVIEAHVRAHLVGLSQPEQQASCEMPPLLLVGPPGLGKTHFISELARLMEWTPPIVLSYAGDQDSHRLTGTAWHYTNSAPGELALRILGGDGATGLANPVVVLDEIDKGFLARAGNNNSLGALYTLLGSEERKRFQDSALPGLRINTAYCRFIATANSLDDIPPPLLDRFFIYQVAEPKEDQAWALANNLWAETLDNWGVGSRVNRNLPTFARADATRLSVRSLKHLFFTLASLVVEKGLNELTSEVWFTTVALCGMAAKWPAEGDSAKNRMVLN